MNHGQLAANWVETYTEVVLAGEEDASWPDVVLLDSTNFWRYVGEGRRGPAFHLLFAYGYDAQDVPEDPWQLPDPVTGERRTAGGQAVGAGRLVAVRAYPTGDAAAWSDFLGCCRGHHGSSSQMQHRRSGLPLAHAGLGPRGRARRSSFGAVGTCCGTCAIG